MSCFFENLPVALPETKNLKSYDYIRERPASTHQAYGNWCAKITFVDNGRVSNDIKRGH